VQHLAAAPDRFDVVVAAGRGGQLLGVIRRQQEKVCDPGLAQAMAEIELRAQVELAKLDQV
jgi:hypothetical protein